MKVYVGQTRSAELIRELSDLGFAEMTVRGEYPPRRVPWAYDNGAFRDHGAGRGFDQTAFEFECNRMTMSAATQPPDFIILPDIVAGGWDSLVRSIAWVPHLVRIWASSWHQLPPLYLPVQDGMDLTDVERYLDITEIRGLFVGGSTEWKEATGSAWCDLAHDHEMRCHIGRVGTPGKVAWAHRCGADSVDSCFPLWTDARLAEFVRAFRGLFPPEQITLPGMGEA